MLGVDDLDVWFGGDRDRVDAVRGASFTVKRGASFGLVGESGSGKSTILRAIMGLTPTWSGAIAVDGKSVGKKRQKAFYKSVQMVFQDPYASLHPRHSVDHVLGETLYLHGFCDIDTRVVKLLDDVGLSGKFRFRYPHQLSGGQRQRVAIARTILKNPQILIFDEATSSLDSGSERAILTALNEVAEHHTTLVIAHRLSTVRAADRIVVMEDGRIVEQGTHQQLSSNGGLYARLASLQFGLESA